MCHQIGMIDKVNRIFLNDEKTQVDQFLLRNYLLSLTGQKTRYMAFAICMETIFVCVSLLSSPT